MIELHLGDCMDIIPSIKKNSVPLVIADIPYGEVNRKSSGLRNLDKGNADIIDFSLADMVSFIDRINSGSAYIFCGTKQISEIVSLFEASGYSVRVGAWKKTNPSPMNGGKLWLSGLEFCVFARKKSATFNEHCKTALWECATTRGKLHPTQKPIPLMERLILASSNEGDTVLDFTMGSGSTGIACIKTGRNFIGIEKDENYYYNAKERINVFLREHEARLPL